MLGPGPADGIYALPLSGGALHRLAGAPASSAGTLVPVPHVARGPAATGKLSGVTLGLLRLGMTRAQALHAFGRDGVPFYVIYPSDPAAAADPLPEIIDADLVLRHLETLQ